MKPNIKVAFFTVFFLEHGGGLAKYFIETASGLTQKGAFQADVVTMDDKFTIRIMHMTQIFYMSFMTKLDMKLVYKESSGEIKKNLKNAHYFKISSLTNLRKKLQEYDVIYCKNEILEAFILKFLIGYKNLPPIIFGCHTPLFYPENTVIQSKIHNALYNGFVYKFLTSGAKAFHVLNSSDEITLQKLFPKKIITKIFNPLNVTELILLSRKYLYPFKRNEKKTIILWVGRLAEGKGVSELLQIIDYVNIHGYDKRVVFVIVGDGSKILREKILQKTRQWKNVEYLGSVPYKYMPSIYKRSTMFICTSKWETFSYSILEAQAFGIPAIAFMAPAGPRDIIVSNKTGFLVEDENKFVEKIIKTLKDEKIFNNKIIRKITIDKFNSKKIYQRLRKMFFDLKSFDKKYEAI